MLDRLLEKIARGHTLSEVEINELRFQMLALDDTNKVVQTWTRSGMGVSSPALENPHLGQPTWGGSPLHVLVAQRSTDTAIANSTPTYVTFEIHLNLGSAFKLSDDGTKIYVSRQGNARSPFMVSGHASWAANATGFRGAWVEGFSADGTSIATSVLHTGQGFTGIDNVFPFASAFNFEAVSQPLAYIKFYVSQSSGGNLNLVDFYIGLTVV